MFSRTLLSTVTLVVLLSIVWFVTVEASPQRSLQPSAIHGESNGLSNNAHAVPLIQTRRPMTMLDSDCPQNQFRCSENICLNAQKVCDGEQDCYNGSDENKCEAFHLKLLNGSFPWEGRLELTIGGLQGSVCDDQWDDRDATVACHMLGFLDGGQAIKLAQFGQGSGPIWLDDVRCTGQEVSLRNCYNNGLSVHNCQHFEDAAVRCFVPAQSTTRSPPQTTTTSTTATTATTTNSATATTTTRFQSLEVSGSKIVLQVSPDYIIKDITKTITLRCALLDTTQVNGNSGPVTRREITETPENVKYVTSIVVTRNADNERVAAVDDRSAATAEADAGALTVNGDVSGSATLSERAHLEMVWRRPNINQTGGYTCEIKAVDLQGHTVVFTTSVEVSMETPTEQDILNELVRLDREDHDTKTRMAAMEARLAVLEPAHAESGSVACGDSSYWRSNGNSRYIYKDVRFSKPYTSGPPKVTVAISLLDSRRDVNLRMHAAVLNVNERGFRVQCETWGDSYIYKMSVRWTSVVA